MGKGSVPGLVAHLDFRANEKVEQPGIEFDGLDNGTTRRLGTGRHECDRGLVVMEVGGEVELDAKKPVQVADHRGIKTSLGAEIVLYVYVSKSEVVVLRFSCGKIAAEYLELRKLFGTWVLSKRLRGTGNCQQDTHE
jgi:hypothetical protein